MGTVWVRVSRKEEGQWRFKSASNLQWPQSELPGSHAELLNTDTQTQQIKILEAHLLCDKVKLCERHAAKKWIILH